jgi:hypothetical protein
MVVGTNSMMRQVLLPVHVMRKIVPFVCFELQSNPNDLNIFQKKHSGVTAYHRVPASMSRKAYLDISVGLQACIASNRMEQRKKAGRPRMMIWPNCNRKIISQPARHAPGKDGRMLPNVPWKE